MEVLQKSNSVLNKVLGDQKEFAGKARMMKYVVRHEVADGMLLYNVLTCELIHLDKEELRNLGKQEIRNLGSLQSSLTTKWFVVPEEFDEKLLVKQVRPALKFVEEKEGVSSYTILTTTDCNARCFYCYEKGVKRVPMSEETAEKVASYIISSFRSSDSKTPVDLAWFGGEPLFNLKVIDLICQRLKEADVPYSSTMISNAYLFTPEVVTRARKLWKLHNVQVTLDGTEEVYNKAKSFYRIQGSAYKRVLDNIQLLIDEEIHVSIRMNLDLHNADNLMQLADELKGRFGGNKYLSAYSHVLFETCDHVSSASERPQVNALNDRLMDKLLKHGLRKPAALPAALKLYYCMADSKNSITISPKGDFGKCEHFTESEFFSHIDHPEQKDEDKLRKFAERIDELPLCNDCPYYPQCNLIKICFEGNMCSEFEQSQRIKELKESMQAVYEKWQEAKGKRKVDSNNIYKVYPLLDKFVAVNKSGSIVSLNETGKDIFELYIAGKSEPEIVTSLMEEYEGTEAQISEIVQSFIPEIEKMMKK